MIRIKMPLLLLLLLPLCVMAVSACSELHVIGKAAMRELSSEAINVEQASYRTQDQAVKPEKTKVAQATTPLPEPPKMKKERRKGLWEHF